MAARSILVYRTRQGNEPYRDYIDTLRDWRGAAKIDARVQRSSHGNLGDHRSVGQGVIELRIHYGPGYRVYVGLQGEDLMIFLSAGDKSSQAEDIQRAIGYWTDYRNRI